MDRRLKRTNTHVYQALQHNAVAMLIFHPSEILLQADMVTKFGFARSGPCTPYTVMSRECDDDG